MINSRASFGCTLSQDQKTIYVAGGYKKENEICTDVEMYKIDTNTWTKLPSMKAPKCSSGLCEYISPNGSKWLYSIGGLWKGEDMKSVHLLSDIERLSLDNPTEWETLDIKLPSEV